MGPGLSGRDMLRMWPEALQALGILAGWASITWGVASLLVWQVWPISGGVFVLSVVGWKHMTTLFGEGLYVLTRKTGRR